MMKIELIHFPYDDVIILYTVLYIITGVFGDTFWDVKGLSAIHSCGIIPIALEIVPGTNSIYLLGPSKDSLTNRVVMVNSSNPYGELFGRSIA